MKKSPEPKLRATDFTETFSKLHPKCGHRTHNLKEPPYYCFHCDKEWTPVESVSPNRPYPALSVRG